VSPIVLCAAAKVIAPTAAAGFGRDDKEKK
jgi:hypothetical protein